MVLACNPITQGTKSGAVTVSPLKKKNKQGLGCSLLVEHLPSMHKVLGFIFGRSRREEGGRERGSRRWKTEGVGKK